MGKSTDTTLPWNVGTYVSDLHCIKLVCAAVWGDAFKGRLIHWSNPFLFIAANRQLSQKQAVRSGLIWPGQFSLSYS